MGTTCTQGYLVFNVTINLAKPFDERFEINEFICWPFALSNSGRIPAEIIEKLQIDGFCSVVLTYDQPPLCSMVQLA